MQDRPADRCSAEAVELQDRAGSAGAGAWQRRAEPSDRLKALRKGDYAASTIWSRHSSAIHYLTAFEQLSSLALKGNAAADYELGCLYQNGQGVSRNLTEAVTWYVVAADHGVTAAAATLGIIYSIGLGVPEDPQSSADWFRRAAVQQTDTALVLPSDVPQN